MQHRSDLSFRKKKLEKKNRAHCEFFELKSAKSQDEVRPERTDSYAASKTFRFLAH